MVAGDFRVILHIYYWVVFTFFSDLVSLILFFALVWCFDNREGNSSAI